MARMRLALAQLDLTVGDLPGNAQRILRGCHEAAEQGAHLVAFPEMALTGYPIEDLALRPSFRATARDHLDALAVRLADDGLGDLPVVVGCLDADEAGPRNAAAVLHAGSVVTTYAKHHLPNYGVFDEYRYFMPGDTLRVVRVRGVDVVLSICEDLWQDGPAATARAAGAGLLLVLNGSPYERNKDDFRLALCRRRAAEAGCPLAYVNLVGGQDELVFDGDSMVVDPGGEVLDRAAQFEEAMLVVDLDAEPTTTAPADPGSAYPDLRIERTTLSAEPVPAYDGRRGERTRRLDDDEEMYAAIVLGTRDYVTKNGFRTVVLGLSGGIDSSLTAVVAADAIGAANVVAVSMPSRYSSAHSKDDAAELARRTGITLDVVPIHDMVEAFQVPLQLRGLAEENLQARCRAVVLMALSNTAGHLVLATGNKSELAVGYSTIYGDAVGGFAPLKDVLKTQVWRLARWRNAEAERRGETPPIPESVLTKPPSAELRPGQLDADSLPDYLLLDDILDDYVERDRSVADLVRDGFDPETVQRVVRMVDAAEYKRRQYPPGPKVSVRNFGRDRRLPITNAWRERVRP